MYSCTSSFRKSKINCLHPTLSKAEVISNRDAIQSWGQATIMRQRCDRSGLTLIELLVSLFVISVLIGLLLPAVFAIRGQSQRLSCQNNLKQIGLAISSYEQLNRMLPIGKYTDRSDNGLAHSYWTVHILPMLEQQAIFDGSMEEYRQSKNALTPTHHKTLSMPLAQWNCTSDGRSAFPQQTRRQMVVAVSSYVGCLGTDLLSNDGALYPDSRISSANITDGLSNTILVGERPPSHDFWYGWWYAGYGQRGTGSVDGLLGAVERIFTGELRGCEVADIRFRRGSLQSKCDVLHYWSFHPGGANFAFADGSVHFLAYGAADILPQLATRAGTEAATPP
jgi:prepilin-type processing-associated H-X9-DG protein/prepilin-type N-terminal cleavage/methylation domain-containing protein